MKVVLVLVLEVVVVVVAHADFRLKLSDRPFMQ